MRSVLGRFRFDLAVCDCDCAVCVPGVAVLVLQSVRRGDVMWRCRFGEMMRGPGDVMRRWCQVSVLNRVGGNDMWWMCDE